jgi:nicotinamidase-related amidase
MTKKKGLVKKISFGILGTMILFVLIVLINLIISGQYESIVTKGQPIENYSKRKSALLVIDIQEATTGQFSMYPFFRENSDELIKNINRIADSFNNHNILVIHIRSEISNPLINLINSSYAKGSPGAQFDKRIKTTSGLEVIKRAKDSFKNTNLDSILTSNKVSDLYIVGLDAAECINATVEASQNRNYKVNLIEEAILSKSTEMKDSMIAVFKDRGVNVLHIDSLIVLE